MAITFPNSPSSGDTHTTSNGLQYTYDGEKWTTIGTNSAGTWTRSGTTVSLTTAGDDLNVDSGTLFVDASTDRVGVGTTSPGDLLEIKGSFPKFSIVDSDTTNDKFSILHNGGGTIFQVDGNNVGPNSSFLITQIDSTERMRIDSSGRLLVGTTAGAYKLVVSGGVATTGIVASILNPVSGGNSKIHFSDNATYNWTAGTVGNAFAITPTEASTSAGTPALFINSSGRVGIGTTSPNYLLTALAGSGSQNIFQAGQTGVSNGYTISSNGSALTHQWYSAGGEAARIDSSGNVGIGTTVPSAQLDVRETAGNPVIQLSSSHNGADTYSSLRFKNLTANAVADLKFITNSSVYGDIQLAYESRGAERLRIDSSGRVGIGTSTFDDTATALVIKNSAAGSEHTFLDIVCDTNESSRVRFSEDGSNFPGEIKYDTLGQELSINVNSSERMRIDSSGNVGIGTTNLPHKLCVNGNIQLGSASSLRSGSSGGSLQIQGGSTFPGGNIVFGGGSGTNDIRFRTSGSSSTSTERMRINNNGTLFIRSQSTAEALSVRTTQANGNANLIAGFNSASSAITTGGTNVFAVRQNGDVKNTNDSYGALSDIKLKENIVDAGSQWDDFKAVRFRKYNFKEETGYETFTQLGVIAQELELVSPGLVTDLPDLDEDGNDLGTTTKGVKYSILTKKALVALQEAMERIETLEQRLTDAGIA